MPRDALEDSDAFICEVCWHYFINEMTQAEVAQQMGVTRLRVNQAIRKARARNMVRIEIHSPFLPRIEMQEALRERLGIDVALVAPANRTPYNYHSAVGAALASYLLDQLREGKWRMLGVSWGLTIENAVRRMPLQPFPDLEIVSMLGGTSRGASFNTFAVASSLAERVGAKYSLLAAPVYLSESVDREAFLGQEIFEEHFAKFERLDAAILTASDVSPKSFLVEYGLPSEVTQAELEAAARWATCSGVFSTATASPSTIRSTTGPSACPWMWWRGFRTRSWPRPDRTRSRSSGQRRAPGSSMRS